MFLKNGKVKYIWRIQYENGRKFTFLLEEECKSGEEGKTEETKEEVKEEVKVEAPKEETKKETGEGICHLEIPCGVSIFIKFYLSILFHYLFLIFLLW